MPHGIVLYKGKNVGIGFGPASTRGLHCMLVVVFCYCYDTLFASGHPWQWSLYTNGDPLNGLETEENCIFWIFLTILQSWTNEDII